jgi:hypothetical protein
MRLFAVGALIVEELDNRYVALRIAEKRCVLIVEDLVLRKLLSKRQATAEDGERAKREP